VSVSRKGNKSGASARKRKHTVCLIDVVVYGALIY
jgi:hypothetical protein